MPGHSALTGLDWVVIAGYLGVLVVSGVLINRRSAGTTDDYFRGGGRIPAWAAAVSIVATSMSAVSFIGVPQAGYVGDLTYLSTNLGMLIAAVVVAFVFVPAFYRARVQSIYAFVGQRMGDGAGRASSAAFMVGRVFASGARIYVGAIPASLILFGDAEPGHLIIAIGVLSFVGVVYTLVGGVSSVIWSDVIQMAVLLGACVAAIVVIVLKIDATAGQVVSALASGAADGGSKLRVFDVTADPSVAFSLPAAVLGFAIMGIGSYGVDQDLAQRLLTGRDAKAGARSIIGGIVLGIPSVALFLVVGLLLWVFYQRPGMISGDGFVAAPDDTREVFLVFILEQMPAGLSGLMMAGLFAAGLSSLNSAINAMSSTVVNDFYRKLRPAASEASLVFAGRMAVVGWGVVLGVFACACIWLERANAAVGGTLLTFALTVMTFAYAGLIGVFFTALFTKRGSTASAVAALVAGFVLVGLMQPMFWGYAVDLDGWREASRAAWLLWVLDLAFVWKLTIGSGVCFAVCALGRNEAARSAD